MLGNRRRRKIIEMWDEARFAQEQSSSEKRRSEISLDLWILSLIVQHGFDLGWRWNALSTEEMVLIGYLIFYSRSCDMKSRLHQHAIRMFSV